MTQPTVSIFEIPQLLDSICYHLRPQDLERCRHVSRTWNLAFKRHTWRSICIVQPERGQSQIVPFGLSPQQRFKISKHAFLVHSLEMTFAPETSPLATFPWSQLRHLQLHGQHSSQHSGDSPEWKVNTQLMSSIAVQLLEQCPRLQSLTLTEFSLLGEYSLTKAFTDLFPVLGNLRSLTMTGVAHFRLHPILQSLHKTCPERLTDLSISLCPDEWWDSVPPSMDSPRFPLLLDDTSHSKGWALSLKKIAITYENAFFQNPHKYPTLWAFLESCPELVDLSLPIIRDQKIAETVVSTLIRYCPKIKRFDLKCPPEWIEQTQRLLIAYTGLTAFSFDQGLTDHYFQILDTLLGHSGQTLEVLLIYCRGHFKSSEIRRILTGFPRLKVLKMRGYDQSDPFSDVRLQPDQFTIRDLVYGPLSTFSPPSLPLTSSFAGSTSQWQWACQDLESLSLPIYMPCHHSRARPPKKDLAYETAWMTIQLLEILLSLPKLKHVDLEWFWCWVGEGSPSSQVLGLMSSIQGGKDIAKRLDIDWINQENLDWLGIDKYYYYEEDLDDDEDWYERYFSWREWCTWVPDVRDYGLPVWDRNKYRKTGKGRHRRLRTRPERRNIMN